MQNKDLILAESAETTERQNETAVKPTDNNEKSKVIRTLKELIESQKNVLLKLTQNNEDLCNKIVQSFIGELYSFKDYYKFDQASVIQALRTCCELQLSPHHSFNHIFLIPYHSEKLSKIELKTQIGYKGLLKIIWRSPVVQNVYAHLIFEGDEYYIEYGENQTLKHVPNFKTNNLLFAYAILILENNAKQICVLSAQEIEESKDRAIAKIAVNKTKSPWSQHYLAMARAAVLRKLLDRNAQVIREYKDSMDSFHDVASIENLEDITHNSQKLQIANNNFQKII